MPGKTFELIESSELIGYMRFLGAEPIYLPYEFHETLNRPEGWMGLATFRAWLGRDNLASLTLREVAP